MARDKNVFLAPKGKIKKKKQGKLTSTAVSPVIEELSTAPTAVKREKKKKKTQPAAADQQAAVTSVQTANGTTPKKQSKKRKMQDTLAGASEGAAEAPVQPASEGPVKKKAKKAKKAEAAATGEQSAQAAATPATAASPAPAATAAAMPAGTVAPPKKNKQAIKDAMRRARKLKKQEKKEKEPKKAAESAAKAAALKAFKEPKKDKFKRLKKEREEKRQLKALLAAQANGGVLPPGYDGDRKTEKKKKNKKQEAAPAAGAAELEQGATPSKAAQEQSAGQAVSVSALVKEPAPVHETLSATKTTPVEVLPPAPDAAVAEASPSTAAENGGSSQKNSEGRAFQRVKAEEWLDQKGAWSNSYEANFGNSGWGAGAQAVLGKVRGKDFRHEKTKKKRGSYRGGAIDHSVNSFKFDSDGE